MRSQRLMIFVAIALLVVIVSLIDLDRVPPVWWDEGWTMNVARNWVERGHYGQLLNGDPAPLGLTAAFPSIISIAVSFKVLGVGAWQARLPFVLYAWLALGSLYWLGRRVYDRTVAVAAVILLLVTASDPFVHPILVGRQVLAEMIMLTLLLAGYACLWLALNSPRAWLWLLLGAIGLFGIGLSSKAQLLPFWAVSLVAPLLVTLLARRWRLACLFAASLIGSYEMMRLAGWWPASLLQPMASNGQLDLMEMVVIVLLPQIRLTVAAMTLQMALPTILGLVAAGRQLFLAWLPGRSLETRDLMRLSLFGFSASWLSWYVLLSRGAPRYAFPALFVGSLFAAALVVTIVRRLHVTLLHSRSSTNQPRQRLQVADLGGVIVIGVLLAMCMLNINWVAALIRDNIYPGIAARDAADYVNRYAPADAVVETCESEVLFYLQRRYHYPPDEIDVQLVKQQMSDYDQGRPILSGGGTFDYDPLVADPDYLIVGPPDDLWRMPYKTILASGAFRPVFAAGRYEVFERVR